MFETAPTRCRFRGAIHNFVGLAESFRHPRAVVRPRYTTGRRRLLWPTRRRSTPSRHSAPWSRKGLETWHCFRRSRGRDKSASHSRAANLTNVSSTAWRSKLERLITLSTSLAAACCSCAAFSSRVSRAISVGPRGAEPRLATALDVLRPFNFNALRGNALAGLWPALERLLIASTRRLRASIVAGQSTTGHGDPVRARRGNHLTSACPSALRSHASTSFLVPCHRKAYPTANASSSLLARFSLLLEAEYVRRQSIYRGTGAVLPSSRGAAPSDVLPQTAGA
jgi:hypothetical protein